MPFDDFRLSGGDDFDDLHAGVVYRDQSDYVQWLTGLPVGFLWAAVVVFRLRGTKHHEVNTAGFDSNCISYFLIGDRGSLSARIIINSELPAWRARELVHF